MKIAELVSLITPLFIRELYQEDLAEAERVRAAGCPHCGGALHRAHYPRKARGVEEELRELEHRESFCCAECRKRSTPKSVRFLGRKVYVALCVVGASILRSGGTTVGKISAHLGMSEETLRRWARWWTKAVQSSRWWKANQAEVMPPIKDKHWLGELFERFLIRAETVEAAIRKLLTFVSPFTVPVHYPS